MPKADPAEKLRILNDLLGQASDPDRSENALRALKFCCQEHPEIIENIDLGEYVEKLARLHFGEFQEPVFLGFSHWHVPQLEDFSPLWIRHAIVSRMKKLAGRRQALLLVTGLRESICPPRCYWTKRREEQYHRVRAWIDELSCAWATRGSKLQVVVI